MTKNFWFENRRFLLAGGGGLVVFLICQIFIVPSFLAAARRNEAKCIEKHREILRLHAEVKERYWDQLNRQAAYEQHEKAIAKDVCLRQQEIKEEGGDGTLMVQLDEAIDEAWSAMREEARRQEIPLPPKLTATGDFDVRPDDDAEAYQEYYADLEIVRRSLEILVKAGVAQIGKPLLEEPESYRVLENDGVHCLYRGARYQVTGSYESFTRILEAAQEPGSFLQVRVRRLQPASSGDKNMVTAQLEFVRFRFVEVESDADRASSSKILPRRRRR